MKWFAQNQPAAKWLSWDLNPDDGMKSPNAFVQFKHCKCFCEDQMRPNGKSITTDKVLDNYLLLLKPWLLPWGNCDLFLVFSLIFLKLFKAVDSDSIKGVLVGYETWLYRDNTLTPLILRFVLPFDILRW